jgi:hypothetical protein
MAKRKSRTQAAGAKPPLLRMTGRRLQVRNSGLEVWLYDDANRERISAENPPTELPTGMPAKFDELTREGLIVGYSLAQDDDLDVEVHVGEPLSESDLARGRWLAPQSAFLRLPSGRLCVESNDASRVGSGQPTEKGGAVEVPAGDYRLTLYRADYEALSRENLIWQGPQQVIVLTPGGSRNEAAGDLLPFELKRDLSWVGRYQVRGRRAETLAWFPDHWDTFVLNLDAAAVKQLSLAPGTYLRTDVRSPAITLISAYAATWAEARRLPPPAGVSHARGADNSDVAIKSMDEALGVIAATHHKAVAQVKAQPVAAPASAEEGAAALERFIGAAFGPPAAA